MIALVTSALLAVHLNPAGVLAQEQAAPMSATISGEIVGPDGRPVAGGLVWLSPDRASASDADPSGRFVLRRVPAGRHVLVGESPGFGRAEVPVVVEQGGSLSVRVVLPLAPYAETVTVSSTRAAQRLDESPSQVTVLAARELASTPSLALDGALSQVTAFGLFRRTSSLAAHPTTQGVSLRGVGASGASRTLVVVDGIPANDPFGNWVYWTKVPPPTIESVEVAPGGLSSEYGSSAMAGVVNVVTRRPTPRTAAIDGRAGGRGTVGADGYASDARGRVSALVAASWFDTDGYSLVREGDRGTVDRPATTEYASGHWRLDATPRPAVLLFHRGRVFGEDRGNGTPLQVNDSRETLLAGGARVVTGAASMLEANVFAHDAGFRSTYSAIAPDRDSESLSLAQDVDYGDVGANVAWTLASRRHRLTVRAEARRVHARNDEDAYAGGINVRDRRIEGAQRAIAASAQDTITAGAVTLVAGVRADSWRNTDGSRIEVVNATGAASVTGYGDRSVTTWTPRVGVTARVSAGVTVRGSLSRGFRAPSLNELYRPFRVGNVLTESNAALGPERLAEGEVGVNHTVNTSWFWRATAFWDRLDDPIANVTVSQTPALVTRQRQNLGRARVRGIGLELDARPSSRVRLHAAWTLSDARVSDFEADPRLVDNLLPQVPRHRASLRGDILGPRGLAATIVARYDGRRFDDDLNEVPLAGALVVDAGIERPLGRFVTAVLSVENLFDRHYPVQATPVELLGTPRTAWVSVRVRMAGR